MSALANQQQVLLEALFARPADAALAQLANQTLDAGTRGFKVYQANGHVLAERSLASAYPVVAQLIGAEGFSDLARALWHAHPPVRGDVAQWGAALAEFLQNSAQLQDEPYLADVARVEWALHCCASAADGVPDLASLSLLTSEDPAKLYLDLAPGCVALRSAWPLANLMSAHLEGSPSLAEVGRQLRAGLAQDVVVWREGLHPRLRACLPAEADCLQAIQAGEPLARALDLAPGLNFEAWFPMVLQSALVLGVSTVRTIPNAT